MTETFFTESVGMPENGRLASTPATLNAYGQVPEELKELPRWVVWKNEDRGGRPTKVPYNSNTGAKADPSDASTWVDYGDALKAEPDYDGIGCVIAEPYTAIDLDKVRDPATGSIEDWAQDIARQANSYTEISPSGKGLHIWVKGALPSGRRRAGRVEMYDKTRYFTVTGQHLSGTPSTIREFDLASLQSRIETLDPQVRKPPSSTASSTPAAGSSIQASAQPIGKHQSPSEDDFALCVKYARQFDCIPSKIDSAFRQSPLYRQKWERQDYRDRTIQRAIEVVRGLPPSNAGTVCTPAAAPVNWRSTFKSYSEMEQGESPFLIRDFLPEGITFIGGLPGIGKTWFALDIAKALLSGKPFLTRYEVPEPVPVIYLTPEVGERAFRARLDIMQMNAFDDKLLCRTLNSGVYSLDDPSLLDAVRHLKPVVFLDTAIRFSTAENENSAADNRGLTDGMLQLQREGARAVVGIHHSTKASGESNKKLTLETALRGSGDLGAVCSAAWGLQCKNRENLEVVVRCVKARDFEEPKPFTIGGRPYITNGGSYVLIDEHHSDPAEAKDVALDRFLSENPEATYREVEKAVGISGSKVKQKASALGWEKIGCSWEKHELF